MEESFRKYVELGKYLNDLEHAVENDMVEEYQIEAVDKLCGQITDNVLEVRERME